MEEGDGDDAEEVDSIRIVPGILARMERHDLWTQAVDGHVPRCCSALCECDDWGKFKYPVSYHMRRKGRLNTYGSCRCDDAVPTLRYLCQECFDGNAATDNVKRQVEAFKTLEGIELTGSESFNVCPLCRTVGTWEQLQLTEADMEHYRRIAAAESGGEQRVTS